MTAGIPAPGDVVGGKYRVESVLGQGGMGAVLRAQNEATERYVAIKWLLPGLGQSADASARFLREARAMGRVDHPNVVGVLDVGEHDGAVFLVMELLHGSSLRTLLEPGVAMSPARVLELIIPALSGIEAAHRAGVVHRDLKPDNLFVCTDDDGHPTGIKVLDFGISKLRDREQPDRPSITRTGATVGTPHYMSAEQVRGAKDIDLRTDVYSVGVILYEMLTGHVPFDAESYGGLLVAIATAEPQALRERVPTIPEGLDDAILKAIGRTPAQRFETIAELATTLVPFAPPHVKFRPPRRAVASAESTGPIRIQLGPDGAVKSPLDSQETKLGPSTGDLALSVQIEPTQHAQAAQPAPLAEAPPRVSEPRALAATALAPAMSTPQPELPRASVPAWAWALLAAVVVGVVGAVLFASGGDEPEVAEASDLAAPPVATHDPEPVVTPPPPVTPEPPPVVAEPVAPPSVVAEPAPITEPVPTTVATTSADRPHGRRTPRTETTTAAPTTTTTTTTTPPPDHSAPGRTGALHSEEF